MTHVYNTTYVCCIQIRWDHRGCDRLQASPSTVMCSQYDHLLKAHTNKEQMTDVQHASQAALSSHYLLCALHPGGPRWCCSGHSEISPAATRSPRPARPTMPWWREKKNARVKGVTTTVCQGHRHQVVEQVLCGRTAAAAAPGPR